VAVVTKLWYVSPEGRRAVEKRRTASDPQAAMADYYEARDAWRAKHEGATT